MAGVEEISVRLDELEDSKLGADIIEGPFGRPVDPESEIQEIVLESIGKEPNFEAKNDEIEVVEDSILNEVRTDEVHAAKAFMYFKEQQLASEGKETFDQKVDRVIKELQKLKAIVKQKESETTEESKDEPSSNMLQQIEEMQEQVEMIVNPKAISDKLEALRPVKPLAEQLKNLTQSDPESANSEDVVYQLMYNKDCKNVMVAAKISELKKRMNIIQKCMSSWDNKKSSKYTDLSQMLMITQNQIQFMNEK